jgi:hypothetical protein
MVEGFDCKGHVGWNHSLEVIEYEGIERKLQVDVIKRFDKVQPIAGLYELYSSAKVEHCRCCHLATEASDGDLIMAFYMLAMYEGSEKRRL